MHSTLRNLTGIFLVFIGVVLLTVFVTAGVDRPSWPEEMRYMYAFGRVLFGLLPLIVGIRFLFMRAVSVQSRLGDPFRISESSDASMTNHRTRNQSTDPTA
jgi:cadmium resistance protein CadD (predicted permease)